MVLSHLRRGGPQWQTEGRVLSDEHFDFQGGIGGGRGGGEARRMLPRLSGEPPGQAG